MLLMAIPVCYGQPNTVINYNLSLAYPGSYDAMVLRSDELGIQLIYPNEMEDSVRQTTTVCLEVGWFGLGVSLANIKGVTLTDVLAIVSRHPIHPNNVMMQRIVRNLYRHNRSPVDSAREAFKECMGDADFIVYGTSDTQ